MKNKFMRWFSTKCIDIIPIDRQVMKAPDAIFAECHQALEQNEILILFPEGTRSATEERDFKLKRGVHLMLVKYPATPVVPVILRGLGKALPKGEALFVPFNCDVLVGDILTYTADSKTYLHNLEQCYLNLLAQTATHAAD